VIAGHGAPADRLCNKDPFALKSTDYLAELFPNSKFILMIRDGRATVHSIISRKVTITGFDLTNHRQCLTKWNQAIATMHQLCHMVGTQRCIMVYYEQVMVTNSQLYSIPFSSWFCIPNSKCEHYSTFSIFHGTARCYIMKCLSARTFHCRRKCLIPIGQSTKCYCQLQCRTQYRSGCQACESRCVE
jgi:hypothetical protein